jgi:hypothetical protein
MKQWFGLVELGPSLSSSYTPPLSVKRNTGMPGFLLYFIWGVDKPLELVLCDDGSGGGW